MCLLFKSFAGAHSPRALDLSPPGGGANRGPGTNRLHNPLNPIITHSSGSAGCSPPRMSTTPISAISHHNTNPDNHEGSSPLSSPPPPTFQQPQLPPVSSAAAAFIAAAAAAAAASSAQQQQQSITRSPPSDLENNHLNLNLSPVAGVLVGAAGTDPNRPRFKSRRGRGSSSRSARSERMSAALGSGSPRSLSEMSVRGLDLLRYATLAPDGTYRCVECERVQISKHFKNKYSFQRHAFLYHEGAARKVFPCTICQKEFSRPDKMKQHLKQAHDGIPKSSSSSGERGSGGGKGNRGRSLPEDDLPPSTLLINPFRGLSDPADMEGKISSIKESGSRC